MTTPKALAENQLSHEEIAFQCVEPSGYAEVQEHRAALCAGIVKRFVGKEPKVVDAGCGLQFLREHFKHYKGVDLSFGDDIEERIPSGDVVVFMSVLEHVTDLRRVLGNVRARYVYISVPQEHTRMPSQDHVRRVTIADIQAFKPKWRLVGKWMWVLRPRMWRLRYLLHPMFSVFAEDEVTLWETR